MHPHKRVGDDLYLYKGDDVFIIENYYKNRDKKNSRKIKKNKIVKFYKNKILWSIFLTGIIFTAYILNTPYTKFNSNKFQFYFGVDKNEFRTGYSIDFSWDISNSPSQAFITWGDGTNFDLKGQMNHRDGFLVGTTNHKYALQGKYNPILTIWDVYGHQYSKSLELTIQNDMLQFNISCQDQIFEDQEVFINVENVFELNNELRKDVENLTYLYDFGDSQLTSDKPNIGYKWKNEGNYTLSVSIIDSQGTISRRSNSIQVKNKPPEATFTVLSKGYHRALSTIKFSAENSIDTESDKNVLRYLWDWGDNTTSWGKYSTHSFSHLGVYNITLCVIDDDWVSNSYSEEIIIFPGREMGNWFNPSNTKINHPYVAIGTLPDIVYEDDQVQLISEIGLQEGNITDYYFAWSFGDGTSSYEKAPKHAWSKAGVYTITLYVMDMYGNRYVRDGEIAVKEKAPEILGPFSIQGIEGKTIILDVEVYDAILDQPYLKFEWYDQKNEFYSSNKKPIVVLDDGNYRYTLKVIDPSGLISSCKIDITIHPVAPEIFISDYMYYGPPGDIFNTDDVGRITLRAHIYDSSYDLSELRCGWSIKKGSEIFYLFENNDGNCSEVTFKCRETTIYQGQVIVEDPSGNTRIATFEIYSFIVKPFDESTKKLEKFLDIKLSAPEDSIDSDNDNLSDIYEIQVSGTNPFDFDSDNDGLYDGFDNTGIGEQTLGTSPTRADSDMDGLEDGFEYWGWDITIDYFENTSIVHVTSDPLRSRTDNDYLSDYEEYLARSHPRLSDSDSDLLEDHKDPFPASWDNDADNLSDYMETILGTNINSSDSDGDGLEDGEEFLDFQTDPTRKDTDYDFASDNAEFMNYKVALEDEYGKEVRLNLTEPVSLYFPKFFTFASLAQIAFTITFGEYGSDEVQDYGVKDEDVTEMNVTITKPSDDLILYNSITNSTRYFSHVVDITDIMNNQSLAYNYHGEYVIEVRDLNGNFMSGCLLEKYKLDFSRQLDPNCDDYDGDGIMDGVEMGLLVRGTEQIDIKDIYNCTLEGKQYDYENPENNKVSLEIPDIGRVYGANLALEIRSGESVMGKGNISIQVLYQNIKTTIEDSVIFSLFENFDENTNYFFEKELDLSSLITNGKILDYYGKFVLYIDIQNPNYNDTFYISKYSIETDTYIQAELQDTNAWITDASLYDSDADGWSDYYEIFTSKSSPLNKDTDGDKAWDPNDRDPLRNVMLEIRPIRATFYNVWSPLSEPNLEMVIQLRVNDLIDPSFSEARNRIVFCSNYQPTEINWHDLPRKTAYWNEGEGTHYYIDISDDVNIQSNTIPFYFQLWEMLPLTGDIEVFAGAWLSDSYSINEVGHWEELVVMMGFSGIRCQVETIAIERANTIAIFESNSTSFNGHYNNVERMNIIQLHMIEEEQDYEGTPFKPGPNNIVIPTSLFEKTVLNSYLQNEQLEKTPLYSDQEDLFEFYSIDRDGTIVDDQCGDTDFVFVRYNITVAEAMEILNSLLTCAVNQSLDDNNNTITELAIVYEYISTKLNHTYAVSLNLPQGLLAFIPWYSGLINSPFGTAPKTLNIFGIFLAGLLTLVFPISGLVMTVMFTAALFTDMFTEIAKTIGMAILTFLAKLLWILIRVALIIFFFIVLAIEVITTVPLFLVMGISLSIFSLFLDMNVNFGINCIPLYAQDTRIGHVGINIKGSDFILEAWVKWIYWEFFDLFIPYLDMNLALDPDSPLMQPPEDPSSGIGTFLTCGYDQISEYVFNFHTIYWDTPYNTPPEYVMLSLLSPSGNTYNYSMDVSPVGYKSIDYWTGRDDVRTGDPYVYDEIEHTFVPPNWYRGVMFNVTINFKNQFTVNERNGQWYYQFHTRAERENAAEVMWPSDEYAVGPYFNESGSISEEPNFEGLQYTELAPYAGHVNQEFDFSVWWADHKDNTLPLEVSLILELPNGTIYNYEMDPFSSHQYDYSMVSNYGIVTFTEYKCILNFSEYMITETTLFKHHYRAIHQDGSVETLFDSRYVDELGRFIDSGNESDNVNATEVDVWFEGPLVFPYSEEEPMIKKWEVQDLTNNKYLRNFEYGDMIWEEQELVFWVYVYDPDRSSDYYRRPLCYADDSPTLILTNYGDSTEIFVYSDFTWAEYNHDLQADKFWVQIGAGEIGAGLWNFEFTINDTQSNSFVMPEEKLPRIWIVGSVNEIFRERTTSMNFFGFLPTTLFILFAGLARSSSNFYVQIAATVATFVTVIISTGFIINEVYNLCARKNTGGLIGLGLALLTITLCTSLSLGHSGGSSSIGSIGFQTSNIGYFFMSIFSLIGGLIFAFTDLGSIMYELFFAFSDVFFFISLSMVLGMTINSITQPGGKNFDASKWIKNILIAYSLIIALIGLICFIAANIKNGAYTVME